MNIYQTQSETLTEVFSEMVTYFNVADEFEWAYSSYDNFGIFSKWKFHLKRNESQEIVLFSLVLRENQPDSFILQNVNDETKFNDLFELKRKTFSLLKERNATNRKQSKENPNEINL